MFTKKYSHTLLHNILFKEATQMADDYKVGHEVTHSYYNEKLVDGHILAPISANKQSVQNLIGSASVRFASNLTADPLRYNSGDFINNMKGSVVIIEKRVTIKESLQIITKFIKKAGNNFYGAVLRDSNGNLINPLHPLFSIGYLEYEANNTNTKYKLHLYFYPDRAKMDRVLATKSADKDLINQNLQAILQAYASEPISKSICTKAQVDPQTYSIDLEFRTKVKFTNYKDLSTFTAGKEYYLSAQQVLTRGIYFPYYGTSLIRKTAEGRGEGMSCTPFLAVNIGAPRVNEYTGQQPSTFTGICTGSQPGNTLEGIRSLSHSNLSSPMNSNSLLPGALAYADAAIDLALSLYYRSGLIDEEITISSTTSSTKLPSQEYIKLFFLHPDNCTQRLIKEYNLSATEALDMYNQLKDLYKQGVLDEYEAKYKTIKEIERNNDELNNTQEAPAN